MKLFSGLAMYALLLFSFSANADFKSFSNTAYDAAIKAGDTVVVDFHASWCPTCKKQEPILNEIVSMKGYENVVALKADFDKEKDLKKSLNVSKQSTIIVFKGGKEVGRNTGVTAKDELKKLIDMGL
ncbi:MAG: thioredoxin family protein [Bdellovibrionaceae bacterium]|nr:thioredoxin family protein [Pseudobdellovibrionaceae bacterium]